MNQILETPVAPEQIGLPVLRRPVDRAIVAAVLGFVVPAAISAWHILNRTAPPMWDDAWYMEVSVRLWDTLNGAGVVEFGRRFVHAFGIKAPLVSVIPFPAYLIFGRGLTAALLANLACLGLASVFAYRIGKRLSSPFAGALAVWCLNLTPIVYGLSRLFYAENIQMTAVLAWMHYLLAGANPVALGVWLGLGMLAKVSFPLYVAVPAVLLAFRDRTWKDWALTAVIAAAIAGPWYAVNFQTVFGFAFSAGFGSIGAFYGSGQGLAEAFRYLGQVSRGCFSSYWTWTLVLAGAWTLATRIRAGRPLLTREAAAMIAWAAVPLVVLSVSVNKSHRYSDPALAAAAVGLGVLLAGMLPSFRGRKAWAAAAALFIPLCIFWEQTTGERFPLGPRMSHRGAKLSWNGPPQQGGVWGQSGIYEAIARDAAVTPGEKVVVMGLDNEYFNANTASYLAVLNRWPLTFTSLGWGETSIERALARVEDLRAAYIVVVPDFPKAELPAELNQVNAAAADALARAQAPYVLWQSHTLSIGATALVYKREQAR